MSHFPLSPTSLNTWLTCPRQFQAKYITKEVVFKPTEASEFGVRVHKSIEDYLTKDIPLSAEAAFCQPVADWVKSYAAQDGVELHVEHKLANTAPWTSGTPHAPTQWRGRGYGGIADVLLIDHNTRRVIIVDWKTGKRAKDDPTQAQMLALCAAADTHRMYRDVTTMWVFVKAGDIVRHRFMMDSLMPVQETQDAMWRWKRAYDAGNYPPTPNGLCKKWCDVVNCPHSGRVGGV